MRRDLGSESHEIEIISVLIHVKFNALHFTIETLGVKVGGAATVVSRVKPSRTCFTRWAPFIEAKTPTGTAPLEKIIAPGVYGDLTY
jgi:hypothetical protein